MSYPVKWFDSTMGGAPVLSGTAGSMIALLDACLINGFNVLTPTSITVSGGVATVVYPTAHGHLQHQVIAVSGATQAELNGEKRVLSVVDINTLTFDATGIADGTASGTISTKAAPIGTWEKMFSGDNKAVYRCTDLTSTRLYLRVDDSNPNNALARGYESMADMDTGLGPFPTTAQSSTGYVWRKSDETSGAARRWRLFGDAFLFHVFVRWSWNSRYGAAWYQFGDGISYRSGDAYHCMIAGHETTSPSYPGASPYTAECAASMGRLCMARSYSQEGESVVCRITGSRSGHLGFGGPVYPSPVDGGLLLHHPVFITQGGVTDPVRGEMAGIMQPFQSGLPPDGTVIENIEGATGRVIMLVQIDWATSPGRIAIDMTGPWR